MVVGVDDIVVDWVEIITIGVLDVVALCTGVLIDVTIVCVGVDEIVVDCVDMMIMGVVEVV